MSKKIGLALGGGGSRGVCHLGVLKALEEEGIKPDVICGCSMGAVVGACYAKGMSVDKMMNAVLKLKAIKLVDLNAAPISKLALLRGNKMQKLLLSHIGNITFDELNIKFSCIASDIYSGKVVTFKEGSVSDAVRASSSIPLVFPPVKIGGHLLVDGGVLCRVPTVQTKEMGADVVIAVDALVNTKESVSDVKNVFSLIMRIFDVMDNHGSEMKKKIVGQENEVWIEPEMKGLNQYEVKNFQQAFEDGYQTAKAKMKEIKELIEK